VSGVNSDRRILCAAAAIDSLGDGLFLAGSALFFIRGLHLPVTSVGVGLSIGGILGLIIGTDVARLADRVSPRDTFTVLMLVQAGAVGSYVLVNNIGTLALAAAVAALARQGAQAARGGLIAQIAGLEAPALRAYVHAVANGGIACGAALAGLVIAADTHGGYIALMLTDAATFVAAGLTATRLPKAKKTSSEHPARRARLALADRPFLVLTGLSAIISLQFIVSGFLLPLWVAYHTDAPNWLASPLLLLNTSLVVAFQVVVTKRFRGLTRAGTAYQRGGWILGAGFASLVLASHLPGAILATGALVAAMLFLTAGELLTVTGAFGLSFGLAPAHAVSEYQGVWNLGFGLSIALGPGLLTYICLEGGDRGWIALAIVVGLAGSAIGCIAKRLLDPHPIEVAAAESR
jgi:hypothetical protein